jgi:hypothetical protein
MKTLAVLAALSLLVASSAFGQVDANSLRARYGPPLERETFTVRPGIEMIVDYGPNKLACRMNVSFQNVPTERSDRSPGQRLRRLQTETDGSSALPTNDLTPPAQSTTATAPQAVVTKEVLLDELVPAFMRGVASADSGLERILGDRVESIWDYQKVNIYTTSQNGRNTISITFKDSTCPAKSPDE